MASQFKKWIAGLTAVLLLIPGTLVYAASAEGEILSVAPKGPGLWTVSVKAKEGKRSFILSMKTTIKKEIPVDQVKRGDHLAAQSRGSSTQGMPGIPGVKGAFEGMAASTKKALGLPDIPNVQGISQAPKIPGKGQMKPPLPPFKGPAGGAGGAAPEAGAGPGPGEKTGREPKPPPPEPKTQDQMLQEKGFQNEKLLFPAGKDAAAPSGAEVLQVKKTQTGFELTVNAGKGQTQKLTMESGKKVLKILSPGDLKQKDRVKFDFEEQGKVIASLFVK